MFSKLSAKLYLGISHRAILFLLFTLLGTIYSTYAQPDEIDLSGRWDFKADFYAEGYAKKWYSENSLSVAWDEIRVPANWKQFIPFQQFDGIAWYRKRFNLPNDWEQKSITLVFESLTPQSKVWLNGKLIDGKRTGNQVAFSKADNWNRGRENYIIVAIDNLVDNSFRRQSSGILGGVLLKAQSKSHFGDLTISPILSDDSKSGNLTISGSILNQYKQSAALEIKASVFTYGEDTIQLNSISRTIEAGKSSAFSMKSTLKKVKSWSFNNPNLYHLQLDLVNQGDTVKSIIKSFGFSRKETNDATLKLNGFNTKLNGIRYDIKLPRREQGLMQDELRYLRKRGVSLIEIPFKLLSEKLLEACDLHGLLVLVTMPDELESSFGSNTKWLQETVKSYQKHPSLLAWCFRDELESKWVRAIKNNNRSNLVAQFVSTTVSTISDNQYANFLLIESNAVTSDKLLSWGSSLTKIPFWVTTSTTFSSEFISTLTRQSRVPLSLLGCIYNDFEQESLERSTYFKPNTFKSRQHFGVDSLVVTHSGQIKSGKRLKTLIEVRPVKSWQPPSYTIENHWLVWSAYNSMGKVVTGSIELLKGIEPSDKSFIKTFDWKVPKVTPFQIVYQVLNPQLIPIYTHVVFNEVIPDATLQSKEEDIINPETALLKDFLYIRAIKGDSENLWQIQYADDRQKVESAKPIQLINIKEGVYLKKYDTKEKSYFVRFRNVDSSGANTDWSNIIEIISAKKNEINNTLNIVRNESEALLEYEGGDYPFCSFEYKTIRESKWKTTPLYKNTGFALVVGLSRREKYSFKLRFHNRYGTVEYTSQVFED